jgi:hypothetical protein
MAKIRRGPKAAPWLPPSGSNCLVGVVRLLAEIVMAARHLAGLDQLPKPFCIEALHYDGSATRSNCEIDPQLGASISLRVSPKGSTRALDGTRTSRSSRANHDNGSRIDRA